jgi:hypothetical protein
MLSAVMIKTKKAIVRQEVSKYATIVSIAERYNVLAKALAK